MEAALVNLVDPGDVVVVGVNGVFGERMCDVAGRLGAEVVRVEAPWGQPVDPAALLGAHPSPKVIAVVHAETSTGARTDIAPLGEGKGDALLLVDCVTSVGGIEVEPVGEHRSAPQDIALVVAQEVIRPPDGREQRLMAWCSSPAREEAEPVSQPVVHVTRAHRAHPCSRKFDGEWDAVQPPADLRHRIAV